MCRYYETVLKCRKLTEAGSQQLLLDTQAIRGLLLEFPSGGNDRSPSEAYLCSLLQAHCLLSRPSGASLFRKQPMKSHDNASMLIV